jgi:hypothetical protein
MFTLFALAVALQAPVQDSAKKPMDPMKQDQALSVEVTKTRETLIQSVPSGVQGWVTSEAAKFTSGREEFTAEKARTSVTSRFSGIGTNEADALAFLIATDVALKAQAQHASSRGVGAGVPPRDPEPAPAPAPTPPPSGERAGGVGPVDYMSRFTEAEKVATELQKTAAQASADALKALKPE